MELGAEGEAVAIAIWGDHTYPSYAGRAELMLSDPKIPSTLRPFHAMARLPLKEALAMVRRDEALVRKAASGSMRNFVEHLREAKMRPRYAAIVSDSEPSKIGNLHLKAHADEHRLFREAIASAAHRSGIDTIFLVQAEVSKGAVNMIGVVSATLDQWLAEVAVVAGRPWCVDEKTAARAARIALARVMNHASPKRG